MITIIVTLGTNKAVKVKGSLELNIRLEISRGVIMEEYTFSHLTNEGKILFFILLSNEILSTFQKMKIDSSHNMLFQKVWNG